MSDKYKQLDYKNLEEITHYYNSFNKWHINLTGWDKPIKGIVEIINGLVQYDNEYYLPAPTSKIGDICSKLDIKDGRFFTKLYKVEKQCPYTRKYHIYNLFTPIIEIKTIDTLDKLKQCNLQVKNIIANTYSSNNTNQNLMVNYDSSSYSGVCIIDYEFKDFKKWIEYELLSDTSEVQHTELTELMWLLFLKGLEKKILKILSNTADYTSTGYTDYGDYTLNSITFNKNVLVAVNQTIAKQIESIKI